MTTMRQPLHLLDREVLIAIDEIGDFLRQCFKVETSVRSS
jgi:hypothetical protein